MRHDFMDLIESQQIRNARRKREDQRRRRNTQREIEEEIDIVDVMGEAGIDNLAEWSSAPETVNYMGCRYIRSDVCGEQES